jgi:hypothetical protein
MGRHRSVSSRAAHQASKIAIKDNKNIFYSGYLMEIVVITGEQVFFIKDVHEALWIYRD